MTSNGRPFVPGSCGGIRIAASRGAAIRQEMSITSSPSGTDQTCVSLRRIADRCASGVIRGEPHAIIHGIINRGALKKSKSARGALIAWGSRADFGRSPELYAWYAWLVQGGG